MKDEVREPFLSNEREPPKFAPLLLLCATILLETAGTVLLKFSLQEHILYLPAYACYVSSLALFSIVLRDVPLSVAYTTWCTLGTVGVAVASHLLFEERMTPFKWGCVLCTLPCVAGLYLT